MSRAASSRASEGDPEGDRRQADEATWRGRMASARAKVETARKKHETFSQMWLVPDGSYYVDKKTGERINSAEELQGRTAAAKAELDAAEKALENLELEARRASIPGTSSRLISLVPSKMRLTRASR